MIRRLAAWLLRATEPPIHDLTHPGASSGASAEPASSKRAGEVDSPVRCLRVLFRPGRGDDLLPV